jgi:hypothetical protein
MRILAGAAAIAPGPRLTPAPERLNFVVGSPQVFAVKYATGKRVVSQRSGKEEFMISAEDGRRGYVPLEVGAAFDALRLRIGEEIFICNYGAAAGWEVKRTAEASVPSPAPAEHVSTTQSPQHTPPAPPPVKTAGNGDTNADVLARCQIAAVAIALATVAHAKAHGLLITPTFEDIRTMGTVLHIAETGGRK